MIPDNCNLPQNAKWTDFDDDYTAEEREELRELKKRWEDGEIDSRAVVINQYPDAWCFIVKNKLCRIYVDKFGSTKWPPELTVETAWHEAAKKILRWVL